MLNHVTQSDIVKSVRGKRIRILVQIVDNVDPLQREPIEPDASWEFLLSTTDVQNLFAQVDNQLTIMNAPGGQF
jgi:hypothetical protein